MRAESGRSEAFARWFGGHATRRLRRSFDRVGFRGLEQLAAVAAAGPVIVVVNHSSFWDAIVLGYLDHRLGLRSHALMDRRNLAARPFLQKAGAIGIEIREPIRAARDLLAVARALPKLRVLWVFPQGSERPPHEPIEFRAGAAFLAQRSAATVIPMAIRYHVAHTDKPHLWVALGHPLDPSAGRSASAQATAVSSELRRIDDALTAQADGPHRLDRADGFETLYEQRFPWWRRVGEWVLIRRSRRVLTEGRSSRRLNVAP